MRLDKYICSCGIGTRNQVKKIIKDKQITINDNIVTIIDYDVDENTDIVKYNNQVLVYEKYHYFMINKPMGYVTSTKDKNKTVMDLISEFSQYNLVPVGRLDKDTEGLLLITDDGELVHELTSPKKHMPKTYYVELENNLSETDIQKLEKGIPLDDFITSPAIVELITPKTIYLTIYEGRFHQVKRMMHYVDNQVIYLKRVKMGPIVLDTNLTIGSYRKLTKEEINQLKNKAD